MMWFWIFYLSLGTWIMIPGVAKAWEDDEELYIKILGSALAILVWPLIFVRKW